MSIVGFFFIISYVCNLEGASSALLDRSVCFCDDFHADAVVADGVHEVERGVRKAWGIEDLMSEGSV